MDEKEKQAWREFGTDCQRGWVKRGLKSTVVTPTFTEALCVMESCKRDRQRKLLSFDIQIIFKYSNKNLVLRRPSGFLSTATSILPSPPLFFSSSVCLLCISSPTECVSTSSYFKADAARGAFWLSQAAARSILVHPAVGTRDYTLCLPLSLCPPLCIARFPLSTILLFPVQLSALYCVIAMNVAAE